MKLFAIILSIYFLALNLVPCGDTDNVDDDSQVIATMDYDGDHDQDCELCSPFCQCHCCHVHTVDFGIANFVPLQPIISQESFVHFDSLGKDISHFLFQPPRV